MNTTFNISLEAEKGTTLKVVQEEGGLRIIASLLGTTEYGDYENPPIPDGYTHVKGEWNNGFIIQDKEGNQFVWIPVGNLPANGTLNGENFCEKFGRRNYQDDEFSNSEFHEDMDEGLKKQFESVQKYGGFYISRYAVSLVNGKIRSISGEMPLTKVDYTVALKEAERLGTGNVTSHLVYGAEYDSVLEWYLATGKTQDDIAEDSTAFGNYWNCENSPQKVVETGSRNEWQVNGIFDLAGNVWEWTQEANDSSYRTLRGGCYFSYGNNSPVAYRYYYNTGNFNNDVGFRVSLYIS